MYDSSFNPTSVGTFPQDLSSYLDVTATQLRRQTTRDPSPPPLYCAGATVSGRSQRGPAAPTWRFSSSFSGGDPFCYGGAMTGSAQHCTKQRRNTHAHPAEASVRRGRYTCRTSSCAIEAVRIQGEARRNWQVLRSAPGRDTRVQVSHHL